MADPYEFNAPQYFDFIQDAGSGENTTMNQAEENGEGRGAAPSSSSIHHEEVRVKVYTCTVSMNSSISMSC